MILGLSDLTPPQISCGKLADGSATTEGVGFAIALAATEAEAAKNQPHLIQGAGGADPTAKADQEDEIEEDAIDGVPVATVEPTVAQTQMNVEPRPDAPAAQGMSAVESLSDPQAVPQQDLAAGALVDRHISQTPRTPVPLAVTDAAPGLAAPPAAGDAAMRHEAGMAQPNVSGASERPQAEPGWPAADPAVPTMDTTPIAAPDPTAPDPKDMPDSIKADVTLHIAREIRYEMAHEAAASRHRAPHAQDVTRQIAEKLTASDQNRIEITLTPEELGKIRLVITPGDTPSVSVYSENRETLELLRRNADLLQKELRDTGFGGASLSFSDENRDKAPEFHALRSAHGTDDAPLAAVTAQASRMSPDRRLDIRI